MEADRLVPGAAEALAAPRASSSTSRDASSDPAEADANRVSSNACTGRRSTLERAWSGRADSAPGPPCHNTASPRVLALSSCKYEPELRSPHVVGRFAALGLLGRVVGDEQRFLVEDGGRVGGQGGVIPRNSTIRPPGVEERRRIEEQEEEQGHRKDPWFARPIILISLGSS
jgi:hypothetical protein